MQFCILAGEAERYGCELQLHGCCAEGGLSLRKKVASPQEAPGKLVRHTVSTNSERFPKIFESTLLENLTDDSIT